MTTPTYCLIIRMKNHIMICGNAKCIVGCGVFCMKKKLVLTMFVISVSSVLFACSFSDSVITSENAGSEILLAEENGFVDDTSKEEESANGQETKDKKDNTDLNDKNNNDTNITDKDSKEDKNKDENSKDNKADKDTNKENNKDNKKDNNKDENKDDKNKADKNGEVDDSDLKVASKEQAEKEAAEKTDTEKTDTEQENKEQVILAETDQTAAEIEAQAETQRIELEQTEAERIAEEQAAAVAAAEEAERLALLQEAATAASSDDGLALVNAARAEAGLGAVSYDATLNVLAYQRASEICECWGHLRPDGSLCFTILDQNGVNYSACGENIAAGQENISEVINMWLNSPGHRANILNGAYNRMGIAVYYGGEYGTYWVQIFTN